MVLPEALTPNAENRIYIPVTLRYASSKNMRLVYRNKFSDWLFNGFHLQSLTSTRHQTKFVTHPINFCQRSRLTKTNHLNYVRTNLVTMWLNTLCFIDNLFTSWNSYKKTCIQWYLCMIFHQNHNLLGISNHDTFDICNFLQYWCNVQFLDMGLTFYIRLHLLK